MNRYDIVFVGCLGGYTVVPFNGSPFEERGGPALFGAVAASCLKRKIGMVTRVSERDAELLGPLEAAGIDLFLRSPETPQYRIVFPSDNVDERRVFLIKSGMHFVIDDMPPIEPCLVHLSGLSLQEFSLEFLQELKSRGFRLSVDMQCFMFRADEATRSLYLEDIPEKKEILRMVEVAKLDTVEAAILTGTGEMQDQAIILEEWGTREALITSAQGALARSEGKTVFTRFTNTSTRGRMGRGDTLCGAYLARRMDHPVEDALRFAAAATSIKLESAGPFKGSLADIVARMEALPG